MKDWGSFFKGKKITVMGLGLLGRAVNDARFLAEQGAELIVTDLKSDEALRSSLEILKAHPNIQYRLGGHSLDDFKNRDFILKAAGIPSDSHFIEEAKKSGIPIKMSASWFAELSGIPVVGVTGTRGKSTTTHLIYEILKASGMHVLLGGNVRGVSTLALLPEVASNTIAVMELDSWQCRGFGDDGLSPNVGVFTTFYPDHLNYYHDDLDLYLNDKAHLFLHQKVGDTLVMSSQVAPLIKEKFGTVIRSNVIIADAQKFPRGWSMQIPGEHNVLNAMCAIEAARILSIDEDVIRSVVHEFKGVPGRLELVRTINGVKVYNDTTATTPEATLAALEALHSENIILIMGGADKKLEMDMLIRDVKNKIKKVILLSGTGTKRIESEFPEAPIYERLDLALQDAIDTAKMGDVVLFSPAFASFGMFANEFDRGDQFNALVNSL